MNCWLQDIKTSVSVLSQIAELSCALDTKNHDRIWTAFMDLAAILRFEVSHQLWYNF